MGNPTEIALLLWLNAKGQDYMKLREEAKVVNQLTFSTERKYMATLVDSTLRKKRILYIKGAPEIVMGKCGNLSKEQIAQYNDQLLAYQNKAMRTLGLAYKEIPAGAEEDCAALVAEGGMNFMGIFAISDPIRPDVPEAVKKCQSAGISVKIVTGDTPGTATEIARQIGLWQPGDSERNRITGVEFAALSDEEALERVMDLKVMSRARPMDKQRLVQLLQQKGAVVAVTGDGTNDAPALNHAQVGLSVAKEASDITLLDDSFHSIATAVMWGRSLYKNIQRFIVFQLTINVVALLSVLLGAFFGTSLPLTVTQMLWVNLIMDTFAAMALASISPSMDVMNEKPRKRTDFIITPPMRNNIIGVGLAFLAILMGLLAYFKGLPDGLLPDGEMSVHYLTVFFTVFVMLQFWNLFNASVFGTNHSIFKDASHALGMLSVALIILVGQFIIVTFGGKVFRTEPLDWQTWLQIIACTSLVLWIGEIYRGVKRLMKNK